MQNDATADQGSPAPPAPPLFSTPRLWKDSYFMYKRKVPGKKRPWRFPRHPPRGFPSDAPFA
eukprot:8996076-Pyramimonas_sp.AAC.1